MDLNETFETPNSVSVLNLFEQYGWYILICAALSAYIFSRAKPHIDAYLTKRNDQAYAAKYHKNPDLLTARLTAQQEITRKLQQKYDEDAEMFRIKTEEREAKKHEERMKKLEDVPGKKLGSSLRNDYNPLMGDSSRHYRATRKSPCSGGGCGK